MERRTNIRAAIRTLLSHETQPEAAIEISAQPEIIISTPRHDTLILNTTHFETLSPLQASLRENSISASLPDIAGAILESLATRPALSQGLLASYLLEA